ncbi:MULTISPECIES: PD-(D/E)XK nuclease family protein [unclassified Herbaspirillum]|uniref:PD-(D/E)XK nuclease family protein n=1 Tax=unclassified Herbaspirillum TaxID=2624150 RepID=UPI00114D6F83|nr:MULTISPECIES: PD-(D/E)XK nuclease family protein [unclassified Herbaspirillum]MBB5390503.1 ATP-dependent helicase/nuclease subunit B [Herbaspirillum sp. SJZ102]TQK09004.1 ATP-dependent helicase/nuclease subunit B [Herbaspirillum sp. SJZ130]TQK14309.1 ATP-dependent helicase/nuclease subunit B [Herbaspirillum sp. SJZ106]
MPLATIPIPPSADFWQQAVRLLLMDGQPLGDALRSQAGDALDFSSCQLLVPAFSHAQNFKNALARELGRPYLAPRINTLSGWLAMLPPDAQAAPPESERLMQLYAQLREHGWLKKMFSARRNADLLPLAHTLLSLSDELTQALLPEIRAHAGATDAADNRWRQALAQLLEPLAPSAHGMLSDEAQLVWQVWKGQLDASDRIAQRFSAMLALAGRASMPLVWIGPTAPEPLDAAFLNAYAERQTVRVVTLDWHRHAIAQRHPLYMQAWPELADDAEGGYPPADAGDPSRPVTLPVLPALCPAGDLEDAAVQSAQIVLRWLAQGKQEIAVVAQDRVTARRLRALLERAQVAVADETGWKLSTTRAAAALAAWNEVVAARGETGALLDLLKSPFVFPDDAAKADRVMRIEARLRRYNIAGEWQAVQGALADVADGADLECVATLARQAAQFAGRKTLAAWCHTERAMIDALGMAAALRQDVAGEQCLLLLDEIAAEQYGLDGSALQDEFSFAEWRALLNLRLDATSYMPPIADRRVVMLPLNGARLRRFDAVLVIGADAAHLPSPPQETLFFSNAVRRELGLATRASRQRQQLRDLVELLCVNDEVVLCWQTQQDGEPNPVSPWLQRLALKLAQEGLPALEEIRLPPPPKTLPAQMSAMPAPAAPELLPPKLSASAYGSFLACPYQFFASRMLRVAVMDELSDMPEKRDYGSWLHEILTRYHETVRDEQTPAPARAPLLETISAEVFNRALNQHPAALAYYARWQKVMPAYLLWAGEREAQGWHFVMGEEALSHTLAWEDGAIELYGRLDRVDENGQGERALLDYKTRPLASLRQKVRDEDDHQLAFYGLLADSRIDAAHYVALELGADKKIGDAAAPDFPQRQQMLKQQIGVTMQAVAHGAALPANGIDSVCQYCDMRGLCRKGAWL